MTTHRSLARVMIAAAVGIALLSGWPPTAGFAHEGHRMECREASLNAMKADIQAMPDGTAKTTATKEIEAAQDRMEEKDMKACMARLHSAMEAIDQ